jgi:beta-N-acetylhexosaminidase
MIEYYTMELNQKIGQQMIMGVSGKTLTNDEKKFIIENDIGGIILFARNIESPKQVYELNKEIQSLTKQKATKLPLFTSVDMEGGRVARLKKPFTVWPPMRNLGEINSATLSYKFGETMGKELAAVGFNLDFAPCTDIFTNPKNEIIGDRAFSDDPETVAKHASAVVRGFLNSGIMACVKHFPGHGNTLLDSHLDLPIEELSLDEVEEREMLPFKKTFRARVDMVMTAHILFKNIDPEWPVTLSEKFLKDIIGKTGYKKLIITDDLDMHALTKNYGKEMIPVRALQAGSHILLYCNEPDSPRIAIEAVTKAVKDKALAEAVIDHNYDLVTKVKQTRIPTVPDISFSDAEKIIGNPEHLHLAECILKKEVPPGLTT